MFFDYNLCIRKGSAMNGFSEDNYIICQDCFEDYEYRTIQSSLNGCGWIAAYNIRLAMGQSVYFDDVRKEMDAMHRIRMPGPTVMRVMRKYLERYAPNFREYHGKKECIKAAKASKMGMFRYFEEGVPHFVSFVKQTDGAFRFFNVNDGMEDFTASMDDFTAAHFKSGYYIALVYC